MFFIELYNNLLDFVFPRTCVSCESQRLSSEKHICISCLLNLPKTQSHLIKNDTLDQKFWGKVPVKSVNSFLFLSKNSKIQNILYAIKYKNKPELAENLGIMYGEDIKDEDFIKNIDFIIAIPMFKAKQKLRGYNQAEAFGKGLGNALGLKIIENIIIKTKATISQTKTGGRAARYKNTTGVFEILNIEKINGKRILLVDDVLTSGATIDQAATALHNSGAAEIHVLTLAAAV